MRKFIQDYWPPVAASLMFLGTTAWLYQAAMVFTRGTFVYGLDDPYIHLAIAKHFALDHVWGVTPYAFSYCSSSPLWTCLLSLTFAVLDVHVSVPFVLNILCAIGVLFAASRLVNLQGARIFAPSVFVLLLAVVYATPLTSLVFAGLEHPLHALLTILFLHFAAQSLCKAEAAFKLALPLLAVLLTMTRLEGLFLVFIVCVLLLVRGRLKFAIIIGTLAILPWLAGGIISRLHGWDWLPTSVILKGNTDLSKVTLTGETFTARLIRQFMDSGRHVTLLAVGAIFFWVQQGQAKKGFWDYSRLTLFLYACMAIFHLTFAGVGWFFRYEAYLVCAGLVVLAPLLAEAIRGWKVSLQPLRETVAGALAVLSLGGALYYLGNRAFQAVALTPRAVGNIYQQQVQMARFLNAYYAGGGVAANDIGAINFYADLHCLDLAGLGSMDVARGRIDGTLTRQTLEQFAQKHEVEIAVLYPEWFEPFGGLPSQWQPVGAWVVRNNVVLGETRVVFYAANPAAREKLAQNLRRFSAQLPPEVGAAVF
jgi:hypothetical protein